MTELSREVVGKLGKFLKPESEGGNMHENGTVNAFSLAEIYAMCKTDEERSLFILSIAGAQMLPHQIVLLTDILEGRINVSPEDAIKSLIQGHQSRHA